MPKLAHAFVVDDISALARFLAREIAGRTEAPGHLDMLNLLARGAGYRNFQHFKARRAAPGESAPAPGEVSRTRIDLALRCFDAEGAFARWPSKASQQVLCLWALWSVIPSRKDFAEKEFNAFLKARHSFGDHALLRRALFDYGLVTRAKDGSGYRRIEQKPPAEAEAFILALKARSASDRTRAVTLRR